MRLAVILARGLGTRMRRAPEGMSLSGAQEAAAADGHKAMMPFAHPFLDYQLSRLADAGFARACVVLAPEHGAVREYYRAHPPRRLSLVFAAQALPHGTADAVLAAETVTGDEEFAVLNGDNLYPTAALVALARLGGPGLVAFDRAGLSRGGNIPPERLRAFALLSVDEQGELAAIVEKPDEETAAALAESALVSMGCWRLPPTIFAACRAIGLSPRGELELPDAVRAAMHSGCRFRVARCNEAVLDLAQREDVPAIAARLAGEGVDP